MDTLAGMRLFAKVVETGSFSAAARQLALTPSSASRQLSALEDGLGTRLLNRTTRKLSLTEAGSLYFERTRQILADIDEAEAAVLEMQAAPRGTLKLNVPVVLGRRYIAPTLPDFLARYPDVRVDLTVTDHYVDLIEEGADLAIRVGGPREQSFIVRKLATMARVLCASPEYLKAHGTPRRPDDLTRHNCLVYRLRPGEAAWRLDGADGTHEIAVAGNFAANNAESIAAATTAGLGIGLLPIWVVGREIQDERLCVVLADYHAHPSGYAEDLCAVYPHGRNLSAKVRAYVDFIAEQFKAEPDFRVGLPDAG